MSSPAPSNISIDSDAHIVPVPVLLKGKTPVRYEQDALVVPQEVVASSTNFSELRLSPRTACAALEGHSPSREELIFIARGLAGVARQNEANTQANRTQLAALKERADALAKREEDAARLEETYKHWKTDRDQKLREDTDDQGEPEGYEQNEGRVTDFFIPVTDGAHTIHVLAPFIKLDGQHCLGTYGKDEPIYRQELFAPQRLTIDEDGDYPQWFLDAIADPSSHDAIIARSLEMGDWGITAEFRRYFDTVNDLTSLQGELHSLKAHVDALQYQEEQCRRRIIGSHAHESYAIFRHLQEGPYLKNGRKGKFSSIPNSSRRGAARF